MVFTNIWKGFGLMIFIQQQSKIRGKYCDKVISFNKSPFYLLTHEHEDLWIVLSWLLLFFSPRHNLATVASKSILQDVLFELRAAGSTQWGICEEDAVRVYPISDSKANGLGDQGLYSWFLSRANIDSLCPWWTPGCTFTV